ncbi:MAG: pantetheine-phosphate adenylyltransferase [Elusimicrobia bacterium]|nr:pantetheine-phosphate adenylyltransferase [Elusimicrobiota bacterium]
MPRIAVYPGSFDPITNGHMDIVRRARRLFDKVILTVAVNRSKNSTFTLKERVAMAKACVRGLSGVEVDTFEGLLVDYLKKRGSRVIIRGVRAVSDMEYEFQMASMNRAISPEVESVFLMPDERYTYLSSSIIKEVARMGARVGDYLPAPAVEAVRKRFSRRTRP